MEIGTFFDNFYTAKENGEIKSVEEGVARLAEMGVSYGEVSGSSIGERYSVDDLLRILEGNGSKVGSVYFLQELKSMDNNSKALLQEITKQKIDECARVNSKLFMPVPMIISEDVSETERSDWRKYVAEYFEFSGEFSKKYGIQTVAENFSNTKTPFSYIDDFVYIFKNTSNIKYVLDTGNFWFGGEDALIACETFLDKTAHVHLKEIIPCESGRFDICNKKADFGAIGYGIIPHDAILKKLIEAGYSNKMTIEIDDAIDWVKNTVKSLDYLKKQGVKF